MIPSWMTSALTACWRVFCLGFWVFVGCLGVLYWYIPSIQQMQPEVERLLQQELQASSLDLGDVSWSWGWHIGVRCQHASFSKESWGFSIQDSALKVDVGLWQWLHGSLTPLQIQIRGGDVHVRLDASGGSDMGWSRSVDIMPVQVRDVRVHWISGEYAGNMQLKSLDVVPALRELRVRTDALRGVLHWNDTMQVSGVQADVDMPSVLPPAWRSWVRGSSKVHVQANRILRDGGVSWKADWQWQGVKKARVDLGEDAFVVPFQKAHGSLQMDWNPDGSLRRWALEPVYWQWKKNQAQADISWSQQTLHLKASATEVAMPLLWQWLTPIDDAPAWKHWLRQMQAGVAHGVAVDLSMPWSKWNEPPTKQDWAKLHYHVAGDVQDADISLGSEGMLRHTSGHVVVDEQGLQAKVQHAQLPDDAGEVHGHLAIDWQKAMMRVDGAGISDVQKLQHWSDSTYEPILHWYGRVPASSKFSLQWGLGDDVLSALHVQLQPKGVWKLRLYDYDLYIKQGVFVWDIKQGLHAKGVVWNHKMMQGMVNLFLLKDGQAWVLQDVQGKVKGDAQAWVKTYALPVDDVVGDWQADVQMKDGLWSGWIDLSQTAWRNLLGAQKKKGEILRLRYAVSGTKQEALLRYLRSESPMLRVNMTGHLHHNMVYLDVSNIKNPYVDVGLNATIPLAQGAWDVQVQGAYLNRLALPEIVRKNEKGEQRAWKLKADIAKVEWGDVDVRGVQLSISSQATSLAKVHADEVHLHHLEFQNIQAGFALKGHGVVDVPYLSASLAKSKLWASLALSSKAQGGLHWQGFAQASGSLGVLMDQLGLPQRLQGGRTQASFAGWGDVVKDEPWWQGVHGRVRLHAQDGEILQAGTLTKLLAALSWADIPKLLVGFRPDLTREGLVYDHLMLEGYIHDGVLEMPELALRSSAFQLSGWGSLGLRQRKVDVMAVVQPFQNVDAVLGSIPIVGYVLGGRAGSIFRRAYHIHGTFLDAEVDKVSPRDAGAWSSGIIDRFLNIPDAWFGDRKPVVTPRVQP